jgi:hypothetical protein
VILAVALGIPALGAAVVVLHGEPTPDDLGIPPRSLAGPPATDPGVTRVENGLLVKPSPGIASPRMLPAAEANLPDTAEVIGVSVGAEHRAYRVAALSSLPEHHVVNDVVGGRALSVTYCDISRCARAFLGGESEVPPDIGVAGLEVARNRLVLLVDGKRYVQETGEPFDAGGGTGPLGYERHPVVMTTWGKWRAAHPDSLVYVSAPARPRP